MWTEQLSFLPSEEPQSTPSVAPALTPRSTLHKAHEAFHGHMIQQGMSVHTISAFDSDLRLLARYLGTRSVIGQIGTAQLEGFVHYLRHERGVPCNPKSLARRITTLKVFFAWLKGEDAIPTDPAAPIIHKRPTTPLPRVLSEDEINELLKATDIWRRERDKPDARPHLLVTLLLSTGIKKSECMNLSLTDVQTGGPDGPSLLIHYASVRQRFKERRLRLPADIATLVAEYAEQYKPTTKVFECTARNLEYVLDECTKRAGLPARRVSFEVLRWTCAFRDFRDGMETDALRRKLGLSRITWADALDKLQRLAAPAL